jgi:hypothetical protein
MIHLDRHHQDYLQSFYAAGLLGYSFWVHI